MGDENPLEIVGRCEIKIMLNDDQERKSCDVQYALNLPKNFLSIKMMDKLRYSTTFGDN